MTPETTIAELREKAQRANNWGRWARWTDQDGAAHMRGLFMVGNLAAVIPIGEMWVETDPDGVNPIAECYTPELADFIAAANPTAVLALLDAAARLAEVEAERDALAAKVDAVRAMHRERPYADPELRAVAPSLPAFVCQHCWGQADAAVPHPCPTIRALDGETVTKGRECISDLRRAIAGSEGANGPQNDERIADDPPPECRMRYILMSRMDGKPRTSAFTSLYDAQHRMRFYDPEEVAVMRRMSEDEPWEEVR